MNIINIDEELLRELFPEITDDFIFENELTGERLYVNNRKKRRQEKKKRFEKIIKQPLPTEEVSGDITVQGSFTIDPCASTEDISQQISQKIAELFGENIISHSKPKPSNTTYVVKKVYINSGLSTDIRVCKTEEEAINFINKIVREYPELMNTCEFQVEKINGKKEKGNKET
jgi:hypothetical protein